MDAISAVIILFIIQTQGGSDCNDSGEACVDLSANCTKSHSCSGNKRCVCPDATCVDREFYCPTASPSMNPTIVSTPNPTFYPSISPSHNPTAQPSFYPTQYPTVPSFNPTNFPSASPNNDPSISPTAQPSINPSNEPSTSPTAQPTVEPTIEPSLQPSMIPSYNPSGIPTTDYPTQRPTTNPTNHPSVQLVIVQSVNLNISLQLTINDPIINDKEILDTIEQTTISYLGTLSADFYYNLSVTIIHKQNDVLSVGIVVTSTDSDATLNDRAIFDVNEQEINKVFGDKVDLSNPYGSNDESYRQNAEYLLYALIGMA